MSVMSIAGEFSYLSVDSDVFEQVSSDATWSKLSSGSSHIMAIKSNGTLWCVGKNNRGQLGLGDDTDRTVITQVGSESNWTDISCGSSFTLALKRDDTLWATGLNTYGQLGLGDTDQRTTFVQIGALTTWSKIAAGFYHSMAVKTDGTLWCTGRNTAGQLGLGDVDQRLTFTSVSSIANINKLTSGVNFSLVILDSGELYGAGSTNDGQLGLNTSGPINNTFTQESHNYTNWIDVSAGYYHTIAIRATGQCYGAGCNVVGTYGELGPLTGQLTFELIDDGVDYATCNAEYRSTFCITNSGYLYGTGRNNYGSLGLGHTILVNALTAVSLTVVFQAVYSSKWDAKYTVALHGTPTPILPSFGKHMSISGGIRFGGKELIGGNSGGKIYQLDMDAYTDAGSIIRRVRRAQIVSVDNAFIKHSKLQLEFEPGVGLDGEDAPVVTLKWSDNGGNTWTDGIDMSIGEFDNFTKRTIWRRLGKARQRIYEISCMDAVKLIFIDAYAEVDVLQS